MENLSLGKQAGSRAEIKRLCKRNIISLQIFRPSNLGTSTLKLELVLLILVKVPTLELKFLDLKSKYCEPIEPKSLVKLFQ